MKLGEALQKLKTLQGQLSRANSRLRQHFTYIEDREPVIDFDTVHSQIQTLQKQIAALKHAILQTNVSTFIDLPVFEDWAAETKTIQAIILEMAAIRSKLAIYQPLLQGFSSTSITYIRGEENPRQILPIINLEDFEAIIRKLEARKAFLDVQLQQANWATELIE
ncbi:MAG: hypothetical protein ACFFCZ_29340 [Promethearchaeota archaeon]